VEALLQMSPLPASFYYVWLANQTSGGLSSAINGTAFTLGRALVGTQLTTSQTFNATTPYYLAMRRNGSTTEMFVDAVAGASSGAIATSYPQGSATIGVDGDLATLKLQGSIFALRITKAAHPISVLTAPFPVT